MPRGRQSGYQKWVARRPRMRDRASKKNRPGKRNWAKLRR